MLSKSNNPFAMVVLTVLTALQKGSMTDEELLGLWLELVKMLFRKQLPNSKVRAIMRFLEYYVYFDNSEMKTKFDIEIDLITNKSTTMGIEQFLEQRFINKGIEIGRKEGIEKTEYEKNLTFTIKLLVDTDFDAEKIADLVGVSVSFVEEVKASL